MIDVCAKAVLVVVLVLFARVLLIATVSLSSGVVSGGVPRGFVVALWWICVRRCLRRELLLFVLFA